MPDTDPIVIARPDHPISRKDIDSDALSILYRLKKNGYEGYLVGGAIRDLLRGVKPKDFDIATDATPHELKKLFRNSRIIGRRFRLVHVFYDNKNFEVATLRSQVDPSAGDDDLYLEDDNIWGDVESDAFRRDFTINGLYYDIRDFSVIDYVGGVEDIERGVMRCIGDPMIRFREDPVRMLRAIKFAARFDYKIDGESDRAMEELAGEIVKASRFRVTEEIFRILSQRNRDEGLKYLDEFGFLEVLYPRWVADIGDDGLEQVLEFFERVEAQSEKGRYVPLELLAAGLFLPFLDAIDVHNERYQDRAAALADEVRAVAIEMDLPKKLTGTVLTLLKGQLYMLFFAHRSRNISRFVSSEEFDWVWRLHDLAFGHISELHMIQEVWLNHRERLGHPLGGWVDSPDRRDVFSFRGQTGGGRRDAGQPASNIAPRRRGGRRRGRRR